MKTILVDAIYGLILPEGVICKPMYDLLEKYPNPKLVLTGADDEQWRQFNLDSSPYEVFTLRHNPEKTDPKYFEILLEKYRLGIDDVIYFEHSEDAAKTAMALGIKTYFYDHKKLDIEALRDFIDNNIR